MSRVDEWIRRGIEGLLIFSSSILVVVICVEVLARYVLRVPLIGIEEVARMLGVWVYFVAAGYITREGSHIRADISLPFLKSHYALNMRRVVTSSLSWIGAAAFFYFSLIYWVYTATESHKFWSGTGWSWLYCETSLLVGGILMLIYFLVEIIRYIRLLR